MTGYTSSIDFPTTTAAIQPTIGGGNIDAFVTSLNADGSALIYSTYLGGSGDDAGNCIVLDSKDHAHITGVTASSNFPTTAGAFQTICGGFYDTFIIKISFVSSVLNEISLTPNVLSNGSSGTGTITLTSAATSNTAVTLESSDLAVTVPVNVIVLAGNTTASFNVTTTAVLVNTSVTISATFNGIIKQAALLGTPSKLISVKLLPISIVGGKTSKGTVTLSAIAPIGGFVVSLSSSSTGITTVPASVTVLAGLKTATFTITTSPVGTVSASAITASFGGSSKSANLSVTPPALTSVSLKSTAVIGGISTIATVKLTGNAPVGGLTIDLNSSAPTVASVPANVTIPAGAISATFTVTTVPVSANMTIGIHAIYNGVNKAANLTVKAPVITSLSLKPTTVKGGAQNSVGTVTLPEMRHLEIS